MGAAEAYLAPLARRRNLTIRKHTLATRIVIQGGRAVAVEVADGKGGTEQIRARSDARSEIVLSGGAFAHGYTGVADAKDPK